MNTEPDPNPYVAPSTDPSPACDVASDAERVRRDHITHEISIRAIGVFFLLSAAVSVLMIFGFLFGSIITPLDAVLYVVMGVAGLVLGLGLRRLDPRVRIPSAVYCGFGLLWVPVGTVINAYVIYLLLCAKGRVVFSESYKQIIEQTPHVRHRTSVFLWAVFFTLVLVLIGVVLSAVLGL